MEHLLQIFSIIPLLTFVVSLLLPRKNERAIACTIIGGITLQLLVLLLFIGYWLGNGHPTLDVKHFTLFKTADIEIFISFFFDHITAVFALTGALIALLVSVFSRTYMHREAGFKRFFNTLIFFYAGYNIAVFAGNFETLFVGWEIVGVTSFLLIAFYRDRYLPVKNALKVVSFYRLGDIGLILAMWMSHHLWNENITFFTLHDFDAVQQHLQQHYWFGVFVAGMIVIAAAAKSAQFPFSSWLPRAMEGPTVSSAVFYGSLSVHLGVFLLLRTHAYWDTIVYVKALTIVIGLATAVVASLTASVQSTVKTQIAYASAAQIGLIFIEVALGLHTLALFHFAGNAFLRTYQLLVSPSVLGYRIHNMFFSYNASATPVGPVSLSRIKNSLYILSVKEWNMDFMFYQYLWQPFKKLSGLFDFIGNRVILATGVIVFCLSLLSYFYQQKLHSTLLDSLPFVLSAFALILILKVFTGRADALYGWIAVVCSQLFIALSIALLNENFGHNHVLIYLSGSLVSAVVGYICLARIKAIDNDILLNRFHGYSYEQPVVGFVFLMACLGLIGLPFTPTFIGIDLLFSHIHKQEAILIVLTALSFLFIEISVLRIYARIFLGPHKKQSHPIAFRSS